MSIIETLDAIIDERSLLKHPFYQAWNAGTLPLESCASTRSSTSTSRPPSRPSSAPIHARMRARRGAPVDAGEPLGRGARR